MKDRKILFSDFNPTNKAEWLAKVEKDLKGKPLQDLEWQLEQDLRISPFYHREDFSADIPPLERSYSGNDWEIGAAIRVEDVAKANEEAMQALEGGAQALGFQLMQELEVEDLQVLLDGIHLPMVSVNFGESYAEKHPLQLLSNFLTYVKTKDIETKALRGSIDFDPLLDWAKPPIQALAQAMKIAHEELPNFKILQVNGAYYHAGVEESSRELGLILAKTSEYFNRLQEMGVKPSQSARQLQVSVAISKSYFVEIAKLRALRILLANLLQAYGVSVDTSIELVVHFAKESQDENTNTNLIRATTQAMSAVIGGADRLYVLAANRFLKEPATEFTQRMSRNLQHLLKMESYLHQVVDPGAGSYYIEKLTQSLAEKAWGNFQTLEADGAFR